MALYNNTILDHYQNPRNVGGLEAADAVGIVENSACGDVLQLYLQIRGGRIAHATFKTFGCAPAIAASSILTEMITGLTLEQIQKIHKEDISEALGGLPPMKLHCAILAADALQAVAKDHRARMGMA